MSHLANGWSVGRWSALLHDTDRTVRPARARHLASHHERTYSLPLRRLNAAHSKMGLRRPRLTPASPPPGARGWHRVDGALRRRTLQVVTTSIALPRSMRTAVAPRTALRVPLRPSSLGTRTGCARLSSLWKGTKCIRRVDAAPVALNGICRSTTSAIIMEARVSCRDGTVQTGLGVV
jgi:hypothetical protein